MARQSGGIAASASRQGTLQQLDLLRSFVPREMGFTESDLTDCLRQCGFNVNTAAEKLITGDYKKSKGGKRTFLKMTATHSPGERKSTGSLVSQKTPKQSSSSDRHSTRRKDPPSTSSIRKSAHKSTPSLTRPENEMIDLSVEDDDSAEDQQNKASLNLQGTELDKKMASTTNSGVINPPSGWILCQRWISDAICTSRSGAVDHKEVLHTEASGPTFLRLRGRALEGRFPDHIGRLLNPLLRGNLVRLEANSLMQEKNLPTGASIPVSLTVFLPDPRSFFEVFGESSTMAESSRNTFFDKNTKGKASKRKASSLEQAAWDLLQWAQHGDVSDFSADSRALQDTDNNEDGKIEELDEKEFEDMSEDQTSVKAREWSESLTSAEISSRLPECEDPVGLKGVQLRPYQRQALEWMRRREVDRLNRAEQEEQLAFLAELSQANRSSNSPVSATTTQDVVCDCGAVQVSSGAQQRAKTCDGETNPTTHPLWQRRFLTDPDRKDLIVFFVNEFMGIASHKPVSPPSPCSGGILADAMGLGKTVMLLGLILRAKQERGRASPSATLVVVKLSLLSQWEDEIRSKTSLTCAVYYGSQASREHTVDELQNVDVVLTTYGTIQGEVKRRNPLLTRAQWLRIILDEAHAVRNENTLASRACCALKAEHRWAVSGTIMMNSMQDLFGILKFLRHEPWSLAPFWKNAVSKPMMAYESREDNVTSEEETKSLQIVLKRLKRVLAPIMLRRTKDSMNEEGKPILNLPPVESKTVFVELEPTEREFYQALLAKSLSIFDGFVDAGTAAKSYLQILSMISRLRQCCDHISLTVHRRLDGELVSHDDNVAIEPKNAASAVKSSRSQPDRAEDVFGRDFMNGLISKLSRSPKRKRQNVAVAKSPSPAKQPRDSYLENVASELSKIVQSQSSHTADECPICIENTKVSEAILTPCGHLFCRKCLVEVFQKNAPESKDSCPDGTCPVCAKHVPSNRLVALCASQDDPALVVPSYLTAPSPTMTPSNTGTPHDLPQILTARTILQEAVDGRDDSSKMKAVFSELQDVWELDPGSKVIIFSQFLGFLDLLQPRLAAMGIPYYRLDGQLTLSKRVDVLKEFRGASRPPGDTNKGSVLLMSMNAGGEGLNLVAASTVFLVDPWWNSAKEDQCINRIVRLGQKASVCRVRKFVVRQSVEERIVELQQRKKYMSDELYETVGRREGCGPTSGSARLTLEDLQALFQS